MNNIENLIKNLEKYFNEKNLDEENLYKEINKYLNKKNYKKENNQLKVKSNSSISKSKKNNLIRNNNILDRFDIKKSKKSIFKFNSIDDVSNSLKLIKNVDSIASYLKNNEDESARIYLKILNMYIKNIDKKLKLEDEFDDDYGDEFIEKFINILSNDFLNKFMDSILKRLKNNNNSSFMNGLLIKINNYLKNLTIYTKVIYQEEILSEEDINKFKMTVIKTDDSQLNKKICDVNRLPYFLETFDEYHEEYIRVIKGSISCYSNKL